MKKFLFGAIALTMLFIACKKGDSGGSSNSWSVGSSTYSTQVTVVTGVSGLYYFLASDTNANGTTVNTIEFVFHSNSAPAAGNYKFVSGLNPGAIEVIFEADGLTTGYASTGKDNVSATVAVNASGKMTINMPKAWAKNLTVSTTDSVQVSANVFQL